MVAEKTTAHSPKKGGGENESRPSKKIVRLHIKEDGITLGPYDPYAEFCDLDKKRAAAILNFILDAGLDPLHLPLGSKQFISEACIAELQNSPLRLSDSTFNRAWKLLRKGDKPKVRILRN